MHASLAPSLALAAYGEAAGEANRQEGLLRTLQLDLG